MGTLKTYRTITPDGPGEALFEDRKSQFFGYAIHAESADEAIEFRHKVRELIPDASHYVSAWILADGAEFYSDAKEPHGTAGLPVLNAIKGRELQDCACVVARIFGGTLLGKGGLMRAYTKAASDALDAAAIATRTPCRLVKVELPYAQYEPITKQLEGWGAQLEDSVFAEQVTLRLSVASGQSDELVSRIHDFTNGRAICTFGPEELRYRQ